VRSRPLTARSAICPCYGYQIAKGKPSWLQGMHGVDDKFLQNFARKTGKEVATWKTKVWKNNITCWVMSAEALPMLFPGDIAFVTLNYHDFNT